MKNSGFLVLAAVLLFCFCGCGLWERLNGGPATMATGAASDYYPNTEWFTGPVSTHVYENGASAETDYTNIEAYTTEAVYPPDFEKITFTLKNNNPGRYFKFWGGVWLERYDGAEWVRTGYMLIDSNCTVGDPVWRTVSDIDDSGCCVSVRELPRRFMICFDETAEPLTAGRYRLAVYVGPEMAYAEFEFE